MQIANKYQTSTKETCYLSGHMAFANTFFRNRRCRCPLWTRLTVLSKLMYNISKNFSNYLQIPGYWLHLTSQLSLTSSFSDKRAGKVSISLSSIWFMIRNFSSSLISIFTGYIFFTYLFDYVHNFWWFTCIGIQVTNVIFYLISCHFYGIQYAMIQRQL